MVKILSSRGALLLGGVVLGAAVLAATATVPRVAGVQTAATPTPKPQRTVYVSPKGADAPTRGTNKNPWRTINYAVSQAKPGTRIRVAAGTYQEKIQTIRNGTAQHPIVLQAAGKVVIAAPATEGRLMEVRHDYYRIEGLEFKGGDIQLLLQEADHTVMTKNYFHHAGGECVRIKYQSSNNVFERNRVEYCGREDFGGGGDGKNGEGVYIGTAPEQLEKNPTTAVDHSNSNIVRHNVFATHGNECVDIKEGSEQNIVEFNNCTAQRDPDSGGMDSRGNRNIFRYNRIYGNTGAGIRFGGDTERDGVYNEAYGNILMNNAREALKIMRPTQGTICGNTNQGNQRGLSNRSDLKNPGCSWPLLPAGASV